MWLYLLSFNAPVLLFLFLFLVETPVQTAADVVWCCRANYGLQPFVKIVYKVA